MTLDGVEKSTRIERSVPNGLTLDGFKEMMWERVLLKGARASSSRERQAEKVREIGIQLRLEEGEVITNEAIEKRFGEFEKYAKDPILLYKAAKKRVVRLAGETENSNFWTEKIINVAAAHLAIDDIQRVTELENGRLLRLINPWYVDGFEPYSRALGSWNKTERSLIHPRNMSLIEGIETTMNVLDSNKDKPFQVLDMGAGDGVRLGRLKDMFGKKIHTVSVGVENQKMLADESWIGPMTMLPKEWGNRFDMVVSHYAICYATMPIIAVKEALRVLRPGSLALLDVPLGNFATNLPANSPIGRILSEVSIRGDYKRVREAWCFPETNKEVMDLISGFSNSQYAFEASRAGSEDSSGVPVGVLKVRK